MTFLELQNAALTACTLSTATASDARTRVKSYINQWHRRLLARPGFSRLLRDSEITFDSVAGQSVYGLGLPMGRINGIHERSNDWSLQRRDLAWLRDADPGLSTGGSSQIYIPRGRFPVRIQPANPSAIFVKASDAAEVASVYWEVIIAGGATFDRASGTTTLTGTTAVNLDTSIVSVVEVTRLTLSTPALRTVSILEDSGVGTELGVIFRGYTSNTYQHIQLWPTPSGVVTYRLDFTREIADLVQNTEEPLIPPDFHHVLIKGAEYEEWRRLDDDRAMVTRQDLEREITTLNHWLWDLADNDSPDQMPVRHSRLGSWYPAGT